MADCKTMLETLADPNPDALMRTVVIVRRMLIDGNPLVHLVNKNFRFNIVFSVKDVGVLPPEIEDIFQRYEAVDIDASFDPALGANVPTSEVKLSDFLKMKIIKLGRGKSIDVHGVIEYRGLRSKRTENLCKPSPTNNFRQLHNS